MTLMVYRSLPEKERALFLFGSLFDKEESEYVFACDARHAEAFCILAEILNRFPKDLQSVVMLSLLSELMTNI